MIDNRETEISSQREYEIIASFLHDGKILLGMVKNSVGNIQRDISKTNLSSNMQAFIFALTKDIQKQCGILSREIEELRDLIREHKREFSEIERLVMYKIGVGNVTIPLMKEYIQSIFFAIQRSTGDDMDISVKDVRTELTLLEEIGILYDDMFHTVQCNIDKTPIIPIEISCVSMMQSCELFLSKLIKKNIHVKMPVFPLDCIVKGNKSTLLRVIINLCKEASDMMIQGEIVIHVEKTGTNEIYDGPYIHISISHTETPPNNETSATFLEKTKKSVVWNYLKMIITEWGGFIGGENNYPITSKVDIFLPAIA